MEYFIPVAEQGGDVIVYEDNDFETVDFDLDYTPEVSLNATLQFEVEKPAQLDLVDQMEWEDHVEFLTLEEVGLEEGNDDEPVHGQYLSIEGSIYGYLAWFHDGDDEAFSVI
jgi:hypothetical protein